MGVGLGGYSSGRTKVKPSFLEGGSVDCCDSSIHTVLAVKQRGQRDDDAVVTARSVIIKVEEFVV
jgi:hypothetical protein